MSSGRDDGSVGVACVQFTPQLDGFEANLELSLELIGEAADAGHELIVLPELALSGYAFNSHEHAARSAEALPDGPGLSAWRKLAKERGVWIVGGLAEAAGDRLYDTSVLIDRDGEVRSKYRKTHLWGRENLWFDRGTAPGEIVELPFGRVAMAICFDLWVPELFRYYSRRGTDIVCVPSNWSAVRKLEGSDQPIVDHLAIALAHTNAIYIAAADREGAEHGVEFLGASMIVSPRGDMVARANGRHRSSQELIGARVDPREALRRKTWGRFNHALAINPGVAANIGRTAQAADPAIEMETGRDGKTRD